MSVTNSKKSQSYLRSGEYWSKLVALYRASTDFGSDSLQSAIATAMREEKSVIESDFRLIEETVTEQRTYRSLEYIG